MAPAAPGGGGTAGAGRCHYPAATSPSAATSRSSADRVVPVVVVGAGPTGMLAAALLAQQGVRCLLVDRALAPHPQPRAVHLDDEVCRVLARVGLARGFAALSRPALGLRLLDADHRVLAEFPRAVAGPHGWPQANLFDQPALEALLRDRLRELPLVTVREGTAVTGVVPQGSGPARVDLEDRRTGAREHVLAEYVLGCDGAASSLREALGTGMRDLGLAQSWLVVDVATDAELGAWDGVQQVCDPARAATYMRVGPSRHRWEFRLASGETAARYEDPARLLPLLAPWTGAPLPDDLRVLRVAEYEFRAQVARRWQRGRVFLLGDAAHLTPPFTGQGLGAGLRDAANLTWKLAGVLRGDLPAAVLASYEQERRPHATALVRLAVAVGTAMTAGGRSGSAVRRLVAPRLHLVPGLRARALDSATPRLRRSALVARRRGAGRLPGRLCPDLLVDAGRRVDEIAAGRFLVVSRAPLSADEAGEVRCRGAVAVVVTPQHPLGRWLRRGRATAVVVRPDGTVAAAGRSPAGLLRHLPPFHPPVPPG